MVEVSAELRVSKRDDRAGKQVGAAASGTTRMCPPEFPRSGSDAIRASRGRPAIMIPSNMISSCEAAWDEAIHFRIAGLERPIHLSKIFPRVMVRGVNAETRSRR